MGADYTADSEYRWFPRECCEDHKKFDKRTPGLFKEEWCGDAIIALCSKIYYCKGSGGDKLSCKAV